MEVQLAVRIAKKFIGPSGCAVLTEVADENGEIRTDWTIGEIVGAWNRPHSFRTDANPEAGGPIVNVAGGIYAAKTFRATNDQVIR